MYLEHLAIDGHQKVEVAGNRLLVYLKHVHFYGMTSFHGTSQGLSPINPLLMPRHIPRVPLMRLGQTSDLDLRSINAKHCKASNIIYPSLYSVPLLVS